MSRYIDADALIKDVARLHVLNDEAEIRRAYEYNPHSTTTDFEETLVSVFDTIDDAPSIDIVFCKECRWADKCSQNIAMANTYQMYEKIDFCSYGEREGE